MQIIIALQAKMRLFADDDADIILTNGCTGADKYSEGLRKSGIFRRVKYVETFIPGYSKLRKIFDVLSVMFADNKFSRLLWEDDIDYDKVVFHNTNIEEYGIISKIFHDSDEKKAPELIRFEEGLLSTGWIPAPQFHGRAKVVDDVCRFTGKKNILCSVSKYMCFYPELLGTSLHTERREYPNIRIPFITSSSDFLAALNTIFDYDPSYDSFPQKYIYFAAAADADGYRIDEDKIILRLAEIVGTENILVKVHPRDRRGIFERTGLNVIRKSALPWEVIQLNHDFTKHVFVSSYSGSPINITAMKNENIPVFMLYPMIAGKSERLDARILPQTADVIGRIMSVGICKSLKVIGDLEDVLQA